MTDEDQNILTLKNISKFFGKEKILDSINFTVKKNAITTIVGPNGAGKSTIAKIILGIDDSYSGEILYSSKLKFSYLPQNIEINPYIPLSVETLFSNYSIDIKKINFDSSICHFAEIPKLFKKQLIDLSGGQLQKVWIAASILSKPDLLILDEPTKCLDFDHQTKFYDLIAQIKKEISILIISHDLYMVPKSSDLVICLNNHVCCSGLPENFKFIGKEYGFYNHIHNHKH